MNIKSGAETKDRYQSVLSRETVIKVVLNLETIVKVS